MNTSAILDLDELCGILNYAELLVYQVCEWLDCLEQKLIYPHPFPPRLPWLYSNWANAHYLVRRLRTDMAKGELPENEHSRYQRSLMRFGELEGSVSGAEKWGGEFYRNSLDRQLIKDINSWKSALDSAIEHGVTGESYEAYGTYEDYCDTRDTLEYVERGLTLARMEGRLLDLPSFETFSKTLRELDKQFRKILDGQYFPEPWADKSLWWRNSYPHERSRIWEE